MIKTERKNAVQVLDAKTDFLVNMSLMMEK